MSECVVRMEMPKRCDLCDFWSVCKNVADFGKARYFEEPRELTVGMKGCKIVCPLPEGHGRLIDADALLRDIEKYHVSEGKFQHWLELQPTIVPADTAERSET